MTTQKKGELTMKNKKLLALLLTLLLILSALAGCAAST